MMTSADLVASVKKQPVGFGCGVLCIVLGALLYFRSSVIDEKQTEYETKSAEAAKILSNVGISKNLPEQVAEIQAFAKEMESRLVHAGQLAVNLQYFYKLEAENEVKLLDVRQNSIPRGAALSYVGIPYNLTVQGSYKQVLAFLYRLENGRHFCRFSAVNFVKSTGSEGAAQNVVTLTLNLELLGQP
jgi:hypothetical protein